MRCALTIAGSDSVGGAGIQADIRAMNALDVHCCTVVTAVTAQNTRAVECIHPVPEDVVVSQLEAVLKDVDIKAIKTGMLYSAGIVNAVADVLEDHEMPLVVDPVMVAGVGDSLASKDLAGAVRKRLIPICEVITPNRHEAEVLAGMRIDNEKDVRYACEVIGKEACTVMLKGGHMSGAKVTDYVYLSSEITKLQYPRLERAGHGGGCTLSSFITANIAKGMDTMNAILSAREMIQQSIAEMYSIGKGDRLVNPSVRSSWDRKRFEMLDSLDDAAEYISETVPEDLVPDGGMNIAFAADKAAGPEDIAAIEGRMTFHNGTIRRNGKAKFGTAEHLSYVLLGIMEYDPSTRCAMTLAYSDDLIGLMEEVGMSILPMNRKGNKGMMTGELAAATVKKAGYVPDVLTDKGTGRNDRSIRILAKDPEDMMSKLDMIL